MAGLPAGPTDIHRACGSAIVAAAQALDNCVALNTMLNDTDRGFGQAGLAAIFTAGGDPQAATTAALILASFADMTNLAAVARGQQAQPGASNFFYNAARLMGVTPL